MRDCCQVADPPPAVANFVKTIHQDSYRAIDSATKSNLTGRNVFITGASKGIGRAIAIAYAKAGAAAIGLGARSEVLDLEEELREAAKKAGKSEPKVLTVKLDVEDRAMVESAAKKVEADFTRLDILVNNAGSLEPAVRIADSDPDEWWKTWTVVGLIVDQINQPKVAADSMPEHTWILPRDALLPPLDAERWRQANRQRFIRRRDFTPPRLQRLHDGQTGHPPVLRVHQRRIWRPRRHGLLGAPGRGEDGYGDEHAGRDARYAHGHA